MNIGLDLRPSLARPTGVGSYVLALAQRLPALAPQDRFFLFSASFRTRYPDRTWPPNAKLVDRRISVRALNYAWHRLEWPPLDRLVGATLDLTHSPHPLLLPARKAKKIVTIHDLFFLKNPDMTEAEVQRDYVPLVRDHVRRADACRACPRHTASEARPAAGVPRPDRGHPQRIDPAYRMPVPRNGGRRARPPPVAAGSPAVRRQRGPAQEPGPPRHGVHWPGRAPPSHTRPLLLSAGSGWAQGGDDGPADPCRRYLETGEIRALMAASAALVLPSLEEGFGLPVVEAMAAGLPVVCSRGSALEEVAGEAATLVNPLDTRSIADGMEKILDDTARAEKQRAMGLERSRQFDWDIAAARTLEFYRRVLGS